MTRTREREREKERGREVDARREEAIIISIITRNARVCPYTFIYYFN